MATDPHVWAYMEVPMGHFRLTGDVLATPPSMGPSVNPASLPYCWNTSYAYAVDENVDLGAPGCKILPVGEVVEQRSSSPGAAVLFVTTHVHEVHYFGWPCGGPQEAAYRAKCASPVVASVTGACTCEAGSGYYPVGVEDVLTRTSISYSTSSEAGGIKGRMAGSTLSPGDGSFGGMSPMRVDLKFGPTSRQSGDSTGLLATWRSGASIGIAVGDWLRAAGVSLADVNDFMAPDARDAARHPRFRTCGADLHVRARFTNEGTWDEPQVGVDLFLSAAS